MTLCRTEREYRKEFRRIALALRRASGVDRDAWIYHDREARMLMDAYRAWRDHKERRAGRSRIGGYGGGW